MREIIGIVILAIFLMTFSVSATELEVYPETVEIDLIGGDSVQVNMTISWSGSYSASCELTTCIEPDGEGINVTYSRNNFTMEPNSENDIIVFINTSISLVPGIYNITTNVNAEMEEPPKGGDKGNGGGGAHWSPGYIPLEPDDEGPMDEEPDDEEPIDEEPDGKEPEDRLFPFWILCIIGFWMVLSIIIVIILLYLNSKRKKKAEKLGEKENEK
jgi:hypothetical protein